MNESSRRRCKHSATVLPFPLACGQALLIGLLAAVILLFLAASVTYAQADPIRAATPAALVTLYLAAAVTGITAARTAVGAPLLAGGICGAVWLVLVLLFSLIAGGSGGCGFDALGSLFAHAGIPIASILGAFVGQKRAKRPSSHRKKRRR